LRREEEELKSAT
jgi:hypothetical protein